MTEDTTSNDKSDQGAQDANAVSYSRTPFYAACNSERYHRQDLIENIQQESQFRLICYVSDRCFIVHDDEVQFRDLLHRIDDGEPIELLLHTPGGDIDAADKLIHMIHEKTGDASFRIVVPHLAKSAGTLMVLGADTVVMSDTSELGPIDPLVPIRDSAGTRSWVAAQHYLDAYKTHSEALKLDPMDRPSEIMLNKLDPAVYEQCVKAKERARRLAEELLKQGMFRNGGNWTATAGDLIDTEKWQTHSQVISSHDASVMRLKVALTDPDDSLWQRYWRLYCLQRLAIGDNEKLFESDYVSLTLSCGGA